MWGRVGICKGGPPERAPTLDPSEPSQGHRLRPSGLYCAAPQTPRLRGHREGERDRGTRGRQRAARAEVGGGHRDTEGMGNREAKGQQEERSRGGGCREDGRRMRKRNRSGVRVCRGAGQGDAGRKGRGGMGDAGRGAQDGEGRGGKGGLGGEREGGEEEEEGGVGWTVGVCRERTERISEGREGEIQEGKGSRVGRRRGRKKG